MTVPNEVTQAPKSGFNEVLLGAVIVLMLALVGLVVGLYAIPGGHLELPELLPGVRVATEENFPVGASRVVSWGDQVILVIRTDEQRYSALQGASPQDNCVLRWDDEAQRVVSPCSHLVFDLRGNVVKGLTTAPLQRYSVFTRGGVVFVGREL
jgi:nitrite reductase/ring-hydroxylating ferredoxin subunit